MRERLGFDGFILSDWAITRDCNERCEAPSEEAPQRPQDIATSWGVRDMSVVERYIRGMEAGIDQFGGTDDVTLLIAAIESGRLPTAVVDASVRRILLPKFRLGLVENPYVDPQAASGTVGAASDFALAEQTQREAQVLLQNRDGTMPFQQSARVWLTGMEATVAEAAGMIVVDEPADADFAIVRTETPSEMLHPWHFFGGRQKEGRLDFRPGNDAYEALLTARSAGIPVALVVFLDRPAILTEVVQLADVILANYGTSDAAVLDVLLGRSRALGRLPVELPRSMEAVAAQHPGAPDDSENPIFNRGAGL